MGAGEVAGNSFFLNIGTIYTYVMVKWGPIYQTTSIAQINALFIFFTPKSVYSLFFSLLHVMYAPYEHSFVANCLFRITSLILSNIFLVAQKGRTVIHLLSLVNFSCNCPIDIYILYHPLDFFDCVVPNICFKLSIYSKKHSA